MKAARFTEKEATAGRAALYKQYAKADEGLKDGLKAAGQSAKVAAEEQQKAMEAIQALKEEQYDADQVIVAYEARKKAKHDHE